MSKTSLKERLSELLIESEITINRLANEVGKSGSTIHRIINNNSKPSHDTVKKIADFFSVNPTWLLTGKGGRVKINAEQKAQDQNMKNIIESAYKNKARVFDFKGNKFIETRANKFMLLSPLLEEMEQERFADDPFGQDFIATISYHPIHVKAPSSGKFFSFEVTGDSMETNNNSCLKKGSIITARVIERMYWGVDSYFEKHDAYVIVYEGELLIRAIKNHNVKNQTITISAYNTAYKDRTIRLHNCRLIMNVFSVTHTFD